MRAISLRRASTKPMPGRPWMHLLATPTHTPTPHSSSRSASPARPLIASTKNTRPCRAHHAPTAATGFSRPVVVSWCTSATTSMSGPRAAPRSTAARSGGRWPQSLRSSTTVAMPCVLRHLEDALAVHAVHHDQHALRPGDSDAGHAGLERERARAGERHRDSSRRAGASARTSLLAHRVEQLPRTRARDGRGRRATAPRCTRGETLTGPGLSRIMPGAARGRVRRAIAPRHARRHLGRRVRDARRRRSRTRARSRPAGSVGPGARRAARAARRATSATRPTRATAR